nr:Ig-like domain-containing protein [Hasllibacter sp. MH4015]
MNADAETCVNVPLISLPPGINGASLSIFGRETTSGAIFSIDLRPQGAAPPAIAITNAALVCSGGTVSYAPVFDTPQTEVGLAITTSGSSSVTCSISYNDQNGQAVSASFTATASEVAGEPSVSVASFAISGGVFDPPPPVTATLSGLAANVGLAGDQVTLTFSEAVTGFELSDLSLTNLAASNLQTSDNTVFTFDVTATGDGTGRISLPAAVANATSGGGANTAAAEITTNAIASRPEISLLSARLLAAPDQYVFTFGVTNPGGAGIRGGVDVDISNFDGPTETDGLPVSSPTIPDGFPGRVTGGAVVFNFPEGAYTDLASGNTSAATGPINVGTFDVTPPSVSISGSPGFPGDPYSIGITFNEPVNGFVFGDITANNATVSDFVNTCGTDPCATFSAVVTADPGSEFTHSVQVLAGVAQDAAGNDNTASALSTPPPPDGTAPVVAITGVPDGFTGPVTATVTFDWGEDVLGFERADISVTGGTLGPITGGRQAWTAELTVDGDANVTVNVAASAVQDASGTPSAAASATGAFASGSVAEEVIRDFLGARSLALLAAQPDLAGLLSNDGPSGNIQVTRGQGIVQMRTGTEGPIWAALDAQWSDLDGFETAYTHLTFGSHMYLQDETLLGVMLQLDHAASGEGLAEIEGTGWLIGPYYVARYGDVDLDARLLWGRTENEISPIGTYTDRFATERILATVNLSGEVELERVTLRPLIGWSYVDDRSESYIDALSNPVAAQRVRLSQLEAALDWTMPLGTGGVDFVGGFAGLFTAEEGGNGDPEGARGRIDLGLRRQGAGPVSFDFGLFYDGIGQARYESYGLDVSVDWRF